MADADRTSSHLRYYRLFCVLLALNIVAMATYVLLKPVIDPRVAAFWRSEETGVTVSAPLLPERARGGDEPGPGHRARKGEAAFSFPSAMGPENAKVRVQVVADEGNSCQEQLVCLWLGVGTLEPSRMRVEFMGPEEVFDANGKPMEIGCEAGVLINGENRFEVETEEERRVIYLTGPGPEGHHGHGWMLEDVAQILNESLRHCYGEAGKLTAPALRRAMEEAKSALPPPKPTA